MWTDRYEMVQFHPSGMVLPEEIGHFGYHGMRWGWKVNKY